MKSRERVHAQMGPSHTPVCRISTARGDASSLNVKQLDSKRATVRSCHTGTRPNTRGGACWPRSSARQRPTAPPISVRRSCAAVNLSLYLQSCCFYGMGPVLDQNCVTKLNLLTSLPVKYPHETIKARRTRAGGGCDTGALVK